MLSLSPKCTCIHPNRYRRGRPSVILAVLTVFSYNICLTACLAATRYVSPSGNDANTPFTNGWGSAAGTIQAAVAASTAGDTVLVTNGTYSLTTEIKITSSISLRSVNGPAETFINGNNTVRCLSITNGVTVSGFTITNGLAIKGAGIYMAAGGSVSNCVVAGNSTLENGFGGGIYMALGGTVSNCTITGNSSHWDGGGVFIDKTGTVNSCTITLNTTESNSYGGGVFLNSGGRILNSTISDNTSAFDGGGVYLFQGGIVSNCTIRANKSGGDGGGAYLNTGGTVLFSSIHNNSCLGLYVSNGSGGGVYIKDAGLVKSCEIYGNETVAGGRKQGGGAFLAGTNSILQNCAVFDNTSSYDGAGVYLSTGMVRQCTITYNEVLVTASYSGGGLYGVNGSIDNTILYYNIPNEYVQGSVSFTNCCTTPFPSPGTGNITNTPSFVALKMAYHLSPTSACINKGATRSYNNSPETDIDRHPRLNNIVDIGADEYMPTPAVQARTTGPYSTFIGSNLTFYATNSLGSGLQYKWDFGDDNVSAWTTSAVIQHAYSITGTVSAALLIKNTQGQSVTNTTVTIADAAPTLSFNPQTFTGLTGSAVQFNVTASYPDWLDFQYRFYGEDYDSGWQYTPDYSRIFANPTSTTVTALCQRTMPVPELTPVGLIATSSAPVNVFKANPSLTVSSPLGSPSPSGYSTYPYGSTVTCSVAGSPWLISVGTQAVCVGWQAVGTAPSSGSSTSTSLHITNDTELFWLWTTQHLLTAQAGTGGTLLSPASQWRNAGTSASVTSAPSAFYSFSSWSGDTQGTTNNAVCTVTMDRARALTAHFIEILATNSTPHWWLDEHSLPTSDAAALDDPDFDNVPTWAEYVANTDPMSASSLPAITQAAQHTASEFVISWQGGSNRWTDIYMKTALTSQWTTLTSGIYSVSGFNVYTDSTVNGSSTRFYRIKFDTEP